MLAELQALREAHATLDALVLKHYAESKGDAVWTLLVHARDHVARRQSDVLRQECL